MNILPKPEVSPSDLLTEYVKLRAEKKVADEKYEEFSKLHFGARMDEIELILLDHLNSTNLQSVSNETTTAYKKVDTSVTISKGDPGAFREYVISNKRFELIDWRANKTAIQEIVKAGQELPPGVNFSQAVSIGIRRK